ncbi:CTP synthase [Fimbriimonas ginsengisoli]|uniref:CTP synthase n=1 Tax=Fimbriimonas ginsengisoli Gsoil 348 TaxID=661478 RepID=A0A068NNR2_FIMGI|nr:CTP synthase [Fimbriimonas ginsengisoli]AIE85056.1 CTP synthase [Fimbriimonas ginsengisoli Gsoil 348]
MTKYIFVTGGVVSSIGKGITTASLGRLLRNRGFTVAPMKLDPYINVDAGTMNPFQHGEVFVTDDGAETDLDLGHYERFMDVSCSRGSSVTTGKVYSAVIDAERRGDYLGGTVQVIPHVTNEIKRAIQALAKEQEADVVIAEIGGTVGDIESLPFLEAIRQMRTDHGIENTMYVHVTLVPTVGPWGEVKTKPTQHSVERLRAIGIAPDVLVCRSEVSLPHDVREKISLFCGVPPQAVIESKTVDTIYEVPIEYEAAGLGDFVVNRLRLEPRPVNLTEWQALVETLKDPRNSVKVAVVGKYTSNGDAYKSIAESLTHAGIPNDSRVEIVWIESDSLENGRPPEEFLAEVDALVVAPGFGGRGIEGKIRAIEYAREKGLPFLGICLGLQMAVIEFARNVCGLEGANSEEMVADAPYPVIHLLPEQKHVTDKGASMRLGSYPCNLVNGTLAAQLYGSNRIEERHRHRYEVNNDFREKLQQHGMAISGVSPDYRLVEMIEVPSHPFFIATQAHPEFRSRPNRPHPLFEGLVRAAVLRRASVGAAT